MNLFLMKISCNEMIYRNLRCHILDDFSQLKQRKVSNSIEKNF
jgi:hypothetical protein